MRAGGSAAIQSKSAVDAGVLNPGRQWLGGFERRVVLDGRQIEDNHIATAAPNETFLTQCHCGLTVF
jgi:hypothetical protein